MSHHAWRYTIPALEDEFYCVAPDLLGFGASDKPRHADYTMQAQGKRVLAIADHLGLDRFALMGHSMGGMIAMTIAAALAPERVTRLVNQSGVFTGELGRRPRFVAFPLAFLAYHFPVIMAPSQRWVENSRFAAGIEFGSWFEDMDSLDFDSWRIDRTLANQPGMSGALYHSFHAIEAGDLLPYAHQVTAPTLVVFGAQDATVPLQQGWLADEFIPNSRLLVFDPCGHFPMYEHTTDFNDSVREFLLS
jgi:pimeloyl-ACP methyl ester carboxylesterase